MENETTNVTNTETAATKTNPVVGALWVNRNQYQKTLHLGLLAGVTGGILGTSGALMGATPFALGIYYAYTNKVKGTVKKVALVTSAFFASGVAMGVGAVIGSSLVGKEIAPSSNSTPAIVAPAPTTVTAPVSSNPIIAKVEAQDNAPISEFNRPRNGGTTTLTQKCEALRAYSGSMSKQIELGFQIGFEHELGSLSVDQACAKVGVPQ